MSTLISAAGFGLAVSGAIGAASMDTYYQAAQSYAPTSGAAYQSWLTALKADGSKVAQPVLQSVFHIQCRFGCCAQVVPSLLR